MNIKEDYVSFEVAKLLKTKGFDEPVATCYSNYNGLKPYTLINTGLYSYKNSTEHAPFWISAPTLQMAMKWLREVHNIHIELNPICYGDTEEDIKWHYGWAVKTTIFTDRWKRHNAEHISYEQAAETAIKYCLKNLI